MFLSREAQTRMTTFIKGETVGRKNINIESALEGGKRRLTKLPVCPRNNHPKLEIFFKNLTNSVFKINMY